MEGSWYTDLVIAEWEDLLWSITPRTALAPPPFPSRPGTSITIDYLLEGSQIANNFCQAQERRIEPSRRMTFLATSRNAC